MPSEIEMSKLDSGNATNSLTPCPIQIEKTDSFSSHHSVQKRTSIAEQVGGSNKSHQCFCGVTVSKQNVKVMKTVIMFVSLILLGGLIFSLIEAPREVEELAQSIRIYDDTKKNIMIILGNNQTLYNALLEADGQLAFSGRPTLSGDWFFSSACMFAFTVVTTIGYGTFAPKTIWGQIFVVFFAIIGIPFSGLTLVHLADAALTCVTRLFTMGSDKVQKAFNVFDTDGSGELDLEEFREAIKSLGIIVTDSQFQELVNEIDQDGSGEIDRDEFEEAVNSMHADLTEAAGRSERIKIVVLVVVVWAIVGSVVFSFAETWEAQESFYFAFVTLATIGLGDFFPKTQFGKIYLIVFITFGLGLLSVLLTLLEGLIADAANAKKLAAEKKRQIILREKEEEEKENRRAARQVAREGKIVEKSLPAKKSRWGSLRVGVRMLAGTGKGKREREQMGVGKKADGGGGGGGGGDEKKDGSGSGGRKNGGQKDQTIVDVHVSLSAMNTNPMNALPSQSAGVATSETHSTCTGLEVEESTTLAVLNKKKSDLLVKEMTKKAKSLPPRESLRTWGTGKHTCTPKK